MVDGTAVDGSAALTADAENALQRGLPDVALAGFATVLGVDLGVVEPTKDVVPGTLDHATARPGDTVSITATGFVGGEDLAGTVFSEPQSIGTASATAAGVGVLSFVVPADLEPGAHVVELEGAGQIARATLTVLAAVVPGDPGTPGGPGTPGAPGAPGGAGPGAGGGADGGAVVVAAPSGLAWTGSGAWIGIAIAAFLLVALGVALRLRRPRDRS